MKKITFHCDKCGVQINESKEVDEFETCDGVNVELDITVTGFDGEGSSVGYDNRSHNLLLCRKDYYELKTLLTTFLGREVIGL
jgi:hypothetical protein